MGESMTGKDRLDTIRRMVDTQKTMRTLMEYVESVAEHCDIAGEKGLALSILMIRESLAVYSKEVVKYTKKLLEEDD
jgi:hypothetical protein